MTCLLWLFPKGIEMLHRVSKLGWAEGELVSQFYRNEFSSRQRIRSDIRRHGPIDCDCSLIVSSGTPTYVAHAPLGSSRVRVEDALT